MAENENIEEVKEDAIPSDNGVETPEVQEETPITQEPVEPPKPVSIEYTKAVEEKIGKVTGRAYKAEAKAELLEQRLRDIETQKEALSLRVPLHHNEFDYLEPRGRGKYWPAIKLRDIKEIDHLIPLIKKAYENRHNWEPYNE